jgi:hypothetical protein
MLLMTMVIVTMIAVLIVPFEAAVRGGAVAFGLAATLGRGVT